MLNSKKHILVFLIVIVAIMTLINSSAFAENISLKYDTVVYSGQPSGVFAAVSAARNGMSTLLILKRDNPGGLMTYGGLNYLDLNYDSSGKIINRGMFFEWYERMGKKQSFSFQKITKSFNDMLKESDVDIIREGQLLDLEVENNYIKQIIVKNKINQYKISADYFIDADQDGNLAFLAGADFFNFGSDINLRNRFMAQTLVFNIDNINLKEFKKDIRSNRYGPSYFNNNLAYGFKEIGKVYRPNNEKVKLRGLNIILHQNSNGNHHGSINALLIFEHNPLDENELKNAYQLGKSESRHIYRFLKENLSGFENIELEKPAEELYVRESRHLIAEYIVKTSDLLENKVFSNSIALGTYPLDYQASEPAYEGFVQFNPKVYGIPYQSILPKSLENLMVVSRSTGMSSLAAASGRVLPIRMNTGAAAGKAASLAKEHNISLKELNENKTLIKEIQEYMELDLNKYSNTSPILQKDKYYPYLKELINLGLLIGGYQNNFRLDETITEYEFSQLLIKGMKRRQSPILYKWVPGGLETISSRDKLDKNNAYRLLLAASSHRIDKLDSSNYYDVLLDENLIPDDIQEIIKENRLLKRKEAYYLIGYFLKQEELSEELKKYRGIENEN
ncbi:MAG: FAD-dependent oxidoreductase [Bacillota bacterium]